MMVVLVFTFIFCILFCVNIPGRNNVPSEQVLIKSFPGNFQQNFNKIYIFRFVCSCKFSYFKTL